jgi:23S rRNA pseudouridine2605 synthase
MATSGLGSRRALEKQISEGRIQVNGARAELGQNVGEGDKINFEGRLWQVVSKPVRHRTLIYNKPEGEVTTRSDPQGRPTVFDKLPRVRNGRWIAIGRLDINTTGLLLLTTDGEFANRMMHPSSNVDREYACRIRGQATEEQIRQLKDGVELEDGPARFSDIQPAGGSGENHWYHVTIMEGRNREVRRLWMAAGLMISRLKRVRYGAAFLPKRLRMGQWAEVSARDHEILREDIGLPAAGSGLSLQQPGARGGKSGAGAKPRKPRKSKPLARRKPRRR